MQFFYCSCEGALDDFRQAEEQTVSLAASAEPAPSQNEASSKPSQETQSTSHISTSASQGETDDIPSGLGLGMGLPSRKSKNRKQPGKLSVPTSAPSSSASGREDTLKTSTGYNHSSHGGGSRIRSGKGSGMVGGSNDGEHSDARLSAVELLAAQTKETVTGIGAGEGRKVRGNGEEEEEDVGEEMLDQEMMQKLMKQLEGMDTEVRQRGENVLACVH